MIKRVKKIIDNKWLLAILTSTSLGVATFAVGWTFKANATIAVLQEKMTKLENDKSQAKAFWKLHVFSYNEINKINSYLKRKPALWPDLNN